VIKSLSEFRKVSGTSSKYRAQCKTCLGEYAKQHGIENRKKRSAQKRSRYWRKRGKEPDPPFDPTVTEKACTKCGTVETLGDFYSESRNKDNAGLTAKPARMNR
jgi:hypothetical protein